MSDELDPALCMGHLKKGGNQPKMSGFAAQDNESLNDELEPVLYKEEAQNNQISTFKSLAATKEDEDMDDESASD